MSYQTALLVRLLTAAALALWPITSSVAAESPEKILGLHIFGSDSDGAPLRDRLLADEFADLKRCDKTGKPAGAKDQDAEEERELEKRLAGRRAAGLSLVDIEDADIWAREKFRCIVEHALGLKKSAWKTRPRLEFFFSFNGGLNPQAEITRLARESVAPILADGKYPLFMIWPTGGLDAYGESLLDVRAGDQIRRNPISLLTAVTQFASDSLRGVAGLPKTLENGVRYNTDLKDRLLVSEQRVHRRLDRVSPVKNVSFSASVDVRNPNKIDLPPPTAAARPATMALSDMGLAAWNNMVRRTRTAIHSTAEFPPKGNPHGSYRLAPFDQKCDHTFLRAPDPEAIEPSFNLRRCYPSGAGAFSRFFHWYLVCVNRSLVPEGSDGCPLVLRNGDDILLRNARFTFVGHSMGTIVINELIASYPTLPYERIVFMAAADSVRSTRKTLAPLIARNGGCTRFYNLMLHPENDAKETTAFGLLPKGSLLEYIDHYLDPAKTIDDRTMGKWINVRATRHMFATEAQKWTLHQIFDLQPRRIGGGPPLKPHEAGTPITHGGFNDQGVQFWSEAFWNPEKVTFEEPARDCAAFLSSQLRPALRPPGRARSPAAR